MEKLENEKWMAGETVNMMKRKQDEHQRIANNIGLFTKKLRANVSRLKQNDSSKNIHKQKAKAKNA